MRGDSGGDAKPGGGDTGVERGICGGGRTRCGGGEETPGICCSAVGAPTASAVAGAAVPGADRWCTSSTPLPTAAANASRLLLFCLCGLTGTPAAEAGLRIARGGSLGGCGDGVSSGPAEGGKASLLRGGRGSIVGGGRVRGGDTTAPAANSGVGLAGRGGGGGVQAAVRGGSGGGERGSEATPIAAAFALKTGAGGGGGSRLGEGGAHTLRVLRIWRCRGSSWSAEGAVCS